MSSRASRLTLVGLAFLFVGTQVAGQQSSGQKSSCDLRSSNGIFSSQTRDGRVNYVSVPRFECLDGTRIEADSSVTFEATSFTQLFGAVIFRDAQKELHAEEAQYFNRAGRLQAQGSVRLVNLEDGSWVTGEDLVLLRETDDRAEETVTVRGGRPHASLVPKVNPDPTGLESGPGGSESNRADPVPYEVDADLIHLVGDRLFQARGRVEVLHESLQSFGDSLDFQQDIGMLTLFDNARILSQDTVSGDTLDVRGDTIVMKLPNDQIDQIEARGRARLLADAVDMRGPMIRLAFIEEQLERVFAVQRDVEEEVGAVVAVGDPPAPPVNPIQPRAVADDFVLTGDSIQTDLAGGELDRVVATGGARGVSTARDSLNTDATNELIRSDWIVGDTITAIFRSASTELTESGELSAVEPGERQIDRLIATGEARTFYRSAPDSTAAGNVTGPQPLELHYVVGDEIRLYMNNGEVERMEVDNPQGVNLRPIRPPAPTDAAVDSVGGVPGSSAAADDDPLPANPPPIDPGPPNANGGTR